MINELGQGIFDNTFLDNPEMREDDYLLCYNENQVLLKPSGNSFEIPRKRDYSGRIETVVFLFTIHNKHCFGLSAAKVNDPGMDFHDIFTLRNLPNQEHAWIGSIGFQLMTWYTNNKYCGRCGSETVRRKEERSVICPVCQLVEYPKISPAVIVAITCNDKILLAKGKNYKGDFYALIAGYVDAGESIEETVVREVKEEVGLDIKNLKYYKSQPWPFSSSLMLGFTAEADDTQPIVIDEKEIKEAGWFTRGELPPHASGISISGHLIEAFEKGIF